MCNCGMGLNAGGSGINPGTDKVKVDAADLVADFLANKLVAGSNISFNILNVGGDEQIEISSTGSTPGLVPVLDEFTALAAQTDFTLSSVPLLPGTVELWVDGIAYVNGIDFNVALNVLSWLNVDFALSAGDIVTAVYKKSGGSPVDSAQNQFVALAAQVAFVLTAVPSVDAAVLMFVNGTLYRNGTDYTVAGVNVTWTNVAFVLPAGAAVLFVYDKTGASVLTERQDVFTAAALQTVFVLSHVPSNVNTVTMYVNGVAYENGVDFTVVGNTLTWGNVDFTMAGGETVLSVYDY